MSITIFECDTCKRSIEKTTFNEGLEVMGRCIISNGCKGLLRKTGFKKGYRAPSIPAPSSTLENWKQRTILHNHNQQLPNTVWFLTHNLNNHPDVISYYYDENHILQQIEPDTIEYTSPNTLTLIFEDAVYGIAQCIANTTSIYTSNSSNTVSLTISSFEQLSVSNTITIGLSDHLVSKTVGFNFKSPTTSTFEPRVEFSVLDNTLKLPTTSPWAYVPRVFVNGKQYTVYEADMSAIINNIRLGNGSVGYMDNTTSLLFGDKEAIFLLTNAPFSSDDKNLIKYGISHTMSSVTAANCLSIGDGELKISNNLLKQSFPSIIIS